ncbi:hypothetical protein IW140_004439 [Coemansia sp. RSA 1813]|nr:hypothetical protein EV178_005190 [Coemansia sp. RSA 1646]KAJ1770296.1 hypothetical protein LPJ74_003300 [Coemansia sp. RSA 1843]KAJ2211828.1 hypothetical protein EV179_005159 [Coemansia sp. RSA 487]KAJ2567531.1 hypothetical protein IW140_004439 [Coemansia sp. RSA 1813]
MDVSESWSTMETTGEQQSARLMLSCDNCRKKKIRCNGGKPVCTSCQRNGAPCHYSPVGPRKKPRRSTAHTAGAGAGARSRQQRKTPSESVISDSDSAETSAAIRTAGHRAKRRASSLQISDNDRASAGVSSVSHLMLERLREVESVMDPGRSSAAGGGVSAGSSVNRLPVMEMLRLQTQISGLVDQLRNITIHHASGITPVSVGSPGTPPRATPSNDAPFAAASRPTDNYSAEAPSSGETAQGRVFGPPSLKHNPVHRWQSHIGSDPGAPAHSANEPSPQQQQRQSQSTPEGMQDSSESPRTRGLNISRDLINHLISVYFRYGHPSETGMHPIELYKDRLERAQVSEPFLLSVLAVASRFSDDPRVTREPAYLSGYDFFERVTRSLMMDVLERDCVENMLTLNNLAVYAVGLPVANRGWYFSGMAMRMATQMSLQKVDAPGRMPGASMMSGPGIESARRAFWTTLLLEALASFASGEPPPITIQDIHVAEPYDDPTMLDDVALFPDTSIANGRSSEPTSGSKDQRTRAAAAHGSAGASDSGGAKDVASKGVHPNVCAYIAQLAMLLVRVARLNGNRHPESAQFSPEYAALHTEMVAWYHGLPDSMQIKPSTAKDEIGRDPQLFGAKMFVHCHYHAAIIALHQPRVDLVRVESTSSGFQESASQQGSALRPRYSNHRSTGTPDQQSWRHLAQQQCLTAACTMTELLTLARTLDVRHHIVTFGFAVFMAGVVHVGAVAYTPRDSTERQYSINCVKEHVRCLDRLGKYFAFHYIMAKHIRAQLQTIQIADERRLKREEAAATLAATALSAPSQMHMHQAQSVTAASEQLSPSFDLSAALGISTQQQSPYLQQASYQQGSSSAAAAATDFSAIQAVDMNGLDAALFGEAGSASAWLNSNTGGVAQLFAQQPSSWGALSSGGGNIATNAQQAFQQNSSSSSMDAFLGLLSSGSPLQQSQTLPASTGQQSSGLAQQPCSPGTTALAMAAGMQGLMPGMSGMAGMAGLSSLAQLFSTGDSSNPTGSLYPEKLLSNSLLAPSPKPTATAQQSSSASSSSAGISAAICADNDEQRHQGSTATAFHYRNRNASDLNISVPDSTRALRSSIAASSSINIVSCGPSAMDGIITSSQPLSPVQSFDPAAPLRLTAPGGMQQFGSLPPYSPM